EMFSLYSSNIEGLYDFDEKVFYTISDDDKPPIAKKLTIAHELVHVLQDQNYGISSLEDLAENDDQLLAIQSLLEGDAMCIEAAYMPSLNIGELGALYEYYMGIEELEMNLFLESIAYFPYIYGELFVSNIVENYGIAYLEEVYNVLPASTEQIMHPEKYYSFELPLEVTKTVTPDNLKLIEENTMGEGMLLTIMSQHVSYDTAKEACEGWGGDHYAFYDSDGTYLSTYDAVWDSVKDAREWYSAFLQYLLDATGVAVAPDSTEAWIDAEDRTIYLRITDDTTMLIISSDENVAHTILE
ncbi:MAG: hypothetical protein NWF07_13045, partial [Candidatus Bathyarchaeota archaeon]|nr:hypothetical protein [Candidatus Bathyarchaeota archaeon]